MIMIFVRLRARLCLLAACHIVPLALASTAAAALTASAGRDQTVGTYVPVVLDGSGSSDSGGAQLKYFWKQTSGAHLDFVGFDRVKPVIISTNPVGSYVFTLTVDNGSTTATDTVTVTVTSPTGTTRYVDLTLTADTSTYSIVNRDNSGTDGHGYKTFQAAANAALPGDTIYVRAGTYTDAFTQTTVNAVKITTSGTATNPIRYQNFNGESVVLRGSGSFEDRDLDHDGFADGVAHTPNRETLVELDASYVQFVGFELVNSEQYGMNLKGSFDYVAEVDVHDVWYECFSQYDTLPNTLQGNVYRWISGSHSRHGSGIIFQTSSTLANSSFCYNNVVVDSIFYLNGFQADNVKVLPTQSLTGDVQGGGNSGGAEQSKLFYDDDPTTNHSVNNYIVRNVFYHNVDDGMSTDTDDLLIEDVYSIANGPTGGNGIKFYKPGKNTMSRGMFSYANLHRGWELRGIAGTTFNHLNCTSIRNWQFGVWSDSVATYAIENVVSAYNYQADYYTGILTAGTHNWAGDGTGSKGLSGNPKLNNDNAWTPSLVPGLADPYPPGNASNNSDDYPANFLPLAWLTGANVATRVAYVRDEIKAAFTPAAGSPLIDAGVLIPGYHCPTADDDPKSPADPNDPRRHWFGSAPDIGAFEYNPGAPPPTPTPTATPAPPQNLKVFP